MGPASQEFKIARMQTQQPPPPRTSRPCCLHKEAVSPDPRRPIRAISRALLHCDDVRSGRSLFLSVLKEYGYSVETARDSLLRFKRFRIRCIHSADDHSSGARVRIQVPNIAPLEGDGCFAPSINGSCRVSFNVLSCSYDVTVCLISVAGEIQQQNAVDITLTQVQVVCCLCAVVCSLTTTTAPVDVGG